MPTCVNFAWPWQSVPPALGCTAPDPRTNMELVYELDQVPEIPTGILTKTKHIILQECPSQEIYGAAFQGSFHAMLLRHMEPRFSWLGQFVPCWCRELQDPAMTKLARVVSLELDPSFQTSPQTRNHKTKSSNRKGGGLMSTKHQGPLNKKTLSLCFT